MAAEASAAASSATTIDRRGARPIDLNMRSGSPLWSTDSEEELVQEHLQSLLTGLDTRLDSAWARSAPAASGDATTASPE